MTIVRHAMTSRFFEEMMVNNARKMVFLFFCIPLWRVEVLTVMREQNVEDFPSVLMNMYAVSYTHLTLPTIYSV